MFVDVVDGDAELAGKLAGVDERERRRPVVAEQLDGSSGDSFDVVGAQLHGGLRSWNATTGQATAWHGALGRGISRPFSMEPN